MFRETQDFFKTKHTTGHSSSLLGAIVHAVLGFKNGDSGVLHVQTNNHIDDPESGRFAWTQRCSGCGCRKATHGYLSGLSLLYPRYDRFQDPNQIKTPQCAIHADQAHSRPHVSPDFARVVWADKAEIKTPVCAAKGSSTAAGSLASGIFLADDCTLSMMSDDMKVAAYHPALSSAGPSTSYTLSAHQLEGRQESSTYFAPSGSITSETVPTSSNPPDATTLVASDTASNSLSSSSLSISEIPTSSITISTLSSASSLSTQTSSGLETQTPSASLSQATSSPTSEGSTSTPSATSPPSSSMDSDISSTPPSTSESLSSTPFESSSLPVFTVATSLPTSSPTSWVPSTETPTSVSSLSLSPSSFSSLLPSPSSSRRGAPLPTPTPSSSRIAASSRATSAPITSTRSTSTPLSTSASHSTRFTTTIVRTVFTNGKTTTVTTVIETNMLSTDIARPSSALAHNTGAIIGIAVSAAVLLLVTVCLIFFGCKRFKSQRSHHGSTDNILGLARETSWRPPIDGDDESYIGGYGATMMGGGHAGPLSRSNSNDDPFMGERLSGEGGEGSAESANVGMPQPVFGGQHLYVPGSGNIREERRSSPENGSSETQIASTDHPGLNNMLPMDDEGRLNNTAGSNYSTTSLTVGGDMSSQSHGATRDGLLKAYSTSRKRGSMPGPRAMPDEKNRRHSSTPPTAFLGTRETQSPAERSPDSNVDKGSIRSFIGKLRNSRHISLQSMMTIRGNGIKATSQESITTRAMSNLYSPSLLNPPIPIPHPSPALLHFPRGVTGNGYNSNESTPYSYRYPHASSVLWPPATLPPSPSPVPTDNSSMVEGLLHPRLRMSSGLPHQASVTSLRDHEDYTRPINGLVNNHIRSTTTFDTHDTMSEHEVSSTWIGTAS